MSFTDEQISEIKTLAKKLNPIAAHCQQKGISVCNQDDFIKLSKGKKVFISEDEEERFVLFFFVNDGLVYKYYILASVDTIEEHCEVGRQNQKERDYSSFSKEELLSTKNNNGYTIKESIERCIKYRTKGKEWIPADFYSEIWALFDISVDEYVDKINNELVDNEKLYKRGGWASRREDVICWKLHDLERLISSRIYDLDDSLNSLGEKFRADTISQISEEIKAIDFSIITKKQRETEVSRLFEKHNPNANKDKYHLKKSDINYIIEKTLNISKL